MKKVKNTFSFAQHSTHLMAGIAKTYLKRFMLKFSKKRDSYPHLEEFILRRKQTGCNLHTLHSTLAGLVKDHDKVIISSMVNGQKTYTSRLEILEHLPKASETTEIIAIPIALNIFKFFRHFVTIIVDRRAGVIEFYDSIGFTTLDYKNAVLWGPKCKKKNLLKLTELMDFVANFYGIDTIIQNKDIHQTDFNQCALFVYDRIYKRGIKGFSFRKASKTPFSSKYAHI